MHYILDNQQEEKEANQETCARVLFGLHHFALCLPFLKAEYIAVDDEDYAQTNLLIAKRILPVLKNFAERTQCPPSYFNRIYTDFKDQCAHWDAALQEMIFAFEYLAEPAKYHSEKAIRRMQIGLHLFAEYLQKMYNWLELWNEYVQNAHEVQRRLPLRLRGAGTTAGGDTGG